MSKLYEKTIIILAILFSVCFVALLWFLSIKNKTPSPIACTMEAKLCPDGSAVGRTGPNCEFSLCPETSISPTSSSNPTANWKTYTNSKYNFSFKYPASYEASSEEDLQLDKSYLITIHSQDYGVSKEGMAYTFGTAIFSVNIEDNKCSTSKFDSDSTFKKVRSNVYDIIDSLGGPFVPKVALVDVGEKCVEIYCNSSKQSCSNNNLSMEFNQILSTFKFTENKAESNTEKQIGYIKKVYEKNGQNYLSIDYIQMLSCNNCPDGYKIVNDDPLLRDFVIDPNVEISLIENNDPSMHKKSSLNDLINFDKNYIIFNIEIDNSSKITKISQVFTP